MVFDNSKQDMLRWENLSWLKYLTIEASILQLFSCMNQLPFQSNLKIDKNSEGFGSLPIWIIISEPWLL